MGKSHAQSSGHMFEKLRRHSHYFTHHCHSFGIVESILKTVIRDCPVGGIAEVHSYFKQVSYLAFLLAYAMVGKQSQSVYFYSKVIHDLQSI